MNNFKKLVQKIKDACESCGELEIDGTKLSEISPKLLHFNEGNLAEHIAVHPAGVAYYGEILKDIKRKIKNLENEKNTHESIKMSEIKRKSDQKISMKAVENEYYRIFQADRERMQKELDELQEQYDTFEIWYEAWVQKGYSFKPYGALIDDDRMSNSNFTKNKDMEDKKSSYLNRGEAELKSTIRQSKD